MKIRTGAYLLRAIDYRDADRIVTLMTESDGKVGAIARGARRSRKRFGGALQPCLLLEAALTRPVRGGEGRLLTLDEVTVRRPFHGLLASLDRIRAAGEALEFVRTLAPDGEPQPRLFEAVTLLFERLETADAEWASSICIAFRMRALTLAGLRPELERCGVSGVACPEGRPALFDPARGSIVSRAHGGGRLLLGPGARKRLLEALTDGWCDMDPWPAQDREEAAAALEAFVANHVRN